MFFKRKHNKNNKELEMEFIKNAFDSIGIYSVEVLV